ncbi:hypothetical protein FHG87_013545 [Trinorchestia longiramus]|nr:hypothetical protein FHG87_013545 [Trinorchestia longiramus]
MSSYVEDNSFLEYNKKFGIKPIYYDYTAFYVTTSICILVAVVLILINLICCCCHKYTPYWADPDTGNRFASFLFVRSPRQKPLDVLIA